MNLIGTDNEEGREMYKTTFDRVFDYYGHKKCMGRTIKAFAVEIDFELKDRHGVKEPLVSLSEEKGPSIFANIINQGLSCRLDPESEDGLKFETSDECKTMFDKNEIAIKYLPIEYTVITEDFEEPKDGELHLGEGNTEAIPLDKNLFISIIKGAIRDDEISLLGRNSAFGIKETK